MQVELEEMRRRFREETEAGHSADYPSRYSIMICIVGRVGGDLKRRRLREETEVDSQCPTILSTV